LIKAKLDNKDGTYYDGQWMAGRPHGLGTKQISSDKCYRGMFKLGRPYGAGSKTVADKIQEGYWSQNNKFITKKPDNNMIRLFTVELDKIKTYYELYGEYLEELPSSTYDLPIDEITELGCSEVDLFQIL